SHYDYIIDNYIIIFIDKQNYKYPNKVNKIKSRQRIKICINKVVSLLTSMLKPCSLGEVKNVKWKREVLPVHFKRTIIFAPILIFILNKTRMAKLKGNNIILSYYKSNIHEHTIFNARTLDLKKPP